MPRYNIAPRSDVPVIRRRDPSARVSGANGGLILQTMQFGLIPSWANPGMKRPYYNARSDSLVKGGRTWSDIKVQKRCVIPVGGYVRSLLVELRSPDLRLCRYYVWDQDKLPYFVERPDGALLMLAGMYDCVITKGTSLI